MSEEVSILGDPNHNRADARMAARIISLGVVPEEKVAAVLGQAFVLAARAAKDNKSREYAAAMSVPLATAKLVLEREKFEHEKGSPPAGNVYNTQINIANLSLQEKRQLLALYRKLDANNAPE
jgi:mannose/fructose/N-acetylgalactosamine-specific phosphotransferase system component IIC